MAAFTKAFNEITRAWRAEADVFNSEPDIRAIRLTRAEVRALFAQDFVQATTRLAIQ